jgi:hypothetical protein
MGLTSWNLAGVVDSVCSRREDRRERHGERNGQIVRDFRWTVSDLVEDDRKTRGRFDSYSKNASSKPCAKVGAVASDKKCRACKNGGREDMLVLFRQRRRVLERRRARENEDANGSEELGETLVLLWKGKVAPALFKDEIGSYQLDPRDLPKTADLAFILPGGGDEHVRVEEQPGATRWQGAHFRKRRCSMVSGSIPMALTSLRASR